MIASLLCINSDTVAVGFVGDIEPQCLIPKTDLRDRLQLQALLYAAVKSLLAARRSLQITVVEPPLFPLEIKTHIAEILLNELHCGAIGFFPKSVSCLAGKKLSEGLVIDPDERLAIPCFDFRELTPMICGNEEGDAVSAVCMRLTIDTRKPVTANVVTMTDTDVWLGASALLKHRQVWPLITREKFKNTGRVWDPLYDIK